MPGKAAGDRPSGDAMAPSPREIRAGWAGAGDVESLWDLLVDSRWDDIQQEDVFRLLIRALEVRSEDPERFAAETFRRTTVLVTSLLLRCHLHLANCIEQDARATRLRARPPGDMPRVAVAELIPRVIEMQEHLAALFASQASVARQWTLVRKNGSARRSRKRVARDGAPAAPDRPRAASADGQATNRIAGLLNGHGGAN